MMPRIFKKLYWSLILRYLIFLGAAVVATFLYLTLTINTLVDSIADTPDVASYMMSEIGDITYPDASGGITIQGELDAESWLEVLDGNEVVKVRGEKRTEQMAYSQSELNDIALNVDELIKGVEFLYEYHLFEGTDGKPYTLLYVKPNRIERMIRLGVNLPMALRGTEFERKLEMRLNRLRLGFVAALLTIIVLFSQLTTKKILRPLKKLQSGLDEVRRGRYDARLAFKGAEEFESIRDDFNFMAEKLERAEEENRAISESKKKLLLDISHDLRTPATTIQGYAEVLNEDLIENEEEKRKYLRYILDKSHVMTDMIDTLFKYSKLESSVYDLSRREYDLGEFLRRILIRFYGEIEEKEMDLQIALPEKETLFSFDRVELERAFSNILSNMIKYNPSGTVLFVNLISTEDHHTVVLADAGVGIDEALQPLIFEALVRGDDTRKSDGGTGLGLAIARKVIELHGGTIELESERDKGTTFTIRFPRG